MELRELVRDLYGVDQPQGCTDEEIAAMKESFGAIPAAVEEIRIAPILHDKQCEVDGMKDVVKEFLQL